MSAQHKNPHRQPATTSARKASEASTMIYGDTTARQVRRILDEARIDVGPPPAAAPTRPAAPAKPQRRHLSGLYLRNYLDGMIQEVGQSDAPLQLLLELIEQMPVNHQRDLICGLIREFRALLEKRTLSEISRELSG